MAPLEEGKTVLSAADPDRLVVQYTKFAGLRSAAGGLSITVEFHRTPFNKRTRNMNPLPRWDRGTGRIEDKLFTFYRLMSHLKCTARIGSELEVAGIVVSRRSTGPFYRDKIVSRYAAQIYPGGNRNGFTQIKYRVMRYFHQVVRTVETQRTATNIPRNPFWTTHERTLISVSGFVGGNAPATFVKLLIPYQIRMGRAEHQAQQQND